MIYDFTKTWKIDKPYTKTNWCYYDILLSEKFSARILIGCGTESRYSIPETIDASSYTQVSLMIKLIKGEWLDEYYWLSKAFNDFPDDLIKIYLSYPRQVSYRMVPIEFVYDLCRHFNLASLEFYCKECGIELAENQNLCWACKNGI